MKGKMIVIGLCPSSDAKLYNHFYNTVQTFIRLDWRWTDRQPSLVCALPTPSFYACWSLSNFLIPFATFPLLTCIAYTAQDLAGSQVTQNTLTAWPLSFLLIIIFFSEKACRFPSSARAPLLTFDARPLAVRRLSRAGHGADSLQYPLWILRLSLERLLVGGSVLVPSPFPVLAMEPLSGRCLKLPRLYASTAGYFIGRSKGGKALFSIINQASGLSLKRTPHSCLILSLICDTRVNKAKHVSEWSLSLLVSLASALLPRLKFES